MKRIAIVCLAVILVASIAQAQRYGGWVGVYADQAGTTCNIVDSGGFVTIHYYLLDTPGATAIEFKSDVSAAAAGWSLLGDQSPFLLIIGGFDSGISISFQTCLLGNNYLGSSTYLVSSQAPACSIIQVGPHPIPGLPGATTPLAVDCVIGNQGWLYVLGGGAVVNDDGSCTCSGSQPIEETSWGKVKALYQ